MRESTLRGIERKMDRKKVENGRCLLISLVIQLNGEGQREEEPWNYDSQWPNVRNVISFSSIS